MVDYSEAEIEAIQRTFPACKIYLCGFHREQAWERWAKDKKHGLSSEDGSILLNLLRDVAQSPSPTDSDQPLDINYHLNVQTLMESEVWRKKSYSTRMAKWKVVEHTIGTLHLLFL